MRNLIAIGLLILLASTAAIAQSGRPLDRIHAAKMAYITDRLHLSRQQYHDFLPLYTDYEGEIKDARDFYFRKYKGTNPGDGDDATSRQFVDDNLDYQQKVIEIKRRYNDQFLKVISPQQLSDLSKAEREFKQILIKRLDRQRGRVQRYGRRF